MRETLYRVIEDKINSYDTKCKSVEVSLAETQPGLTYSKAYVSTTNNLQEQIDELKAQVKKKRIKKITIKI